MELNNPNIGFYELNLNGGYILIKNKSAIEIW